MKNLIKYYFILPAIFLHFVACTVENNASPVIQTKQGKVQGIPLTSRKGRTYHGFLGIPFGKVGQRFEDGVNPDKWDGIKSVTELPPPCQQFFTLIGKVIGVEDCLNLNVYSPNVKKKLPVFVWMFPGGFQLGGASMFEAKYLMDEDVVFVSTNYRLGVLGFLNTGEGTVAGNMGLKDQVLALKWVQQNIAKFGGDPDLVTIFGLSAGGASVQYLTISEMAKGLFHRAIALSGSVLNPWAFQPNPVRIAEALAEKADCSKEKWTWEEKVKCLREMDGTDLINAQLKLMTLGPDYDFLHMQFVPSVESDKVKGPRFLTDTPYNLLSKGKIASKVPMIMGFTGNEGPFWAARIMQQEKLYKGVDQNWNTMAPFIFYFDALIDPAKYEDVSTKIRKYYLHDAPLLPNTEADKGFTDIFSDRFFRNGIAKSIKLQGKVQPIYPYLNDYKGETSLIFAYGVTESQGMSHADDLIYMFNQTFGSSEVVEGTKDGDYSERFIKFLVHFGKTGKPQGWGKEKEWPKFESGARIDYYRIDLEETSLVEDPFQGRRYFWDSLDLKEHEKEVVDKKDGKSEL